MSISIKQTKIGIKKKRGNISLIQEIQVLLHLINPDVEPADVHLGILAPRVRHLQLRDQLLVELGAHGENFDDNDGGDNILKVERAKFTRAHTKEL